MLKFNLTQEGKGLIDALQNNDKLAITHVRLLQFGDSPSVDLPISRGAIVVDGTCNGPYAVVDVNDTSDNHYLASAIALLSDTKSIAELYSDENASGYEVVLSAGVPGRTEYPSIKYRMQNWSADKKIPTRVDIMKGTGDDCDILLSFGSKGGDPNDPSQQEVSARLTLGDNFPKTITFSNGDIWETDDTVSTTGVKNGSDSYGASSENGETSIRPLYSKISIEKDSNKQLKLRLSCQFDGAEKCKFNTTSINLPYATKFREGVVRLADPSIYGAADGQRYNTVYSAADVDAKISQVTSSLGNLDQYAKKATENKFAENNTFTKNVIVNGEIGGAAVTDAGENGDKHIVNVGYADGKYLSKTEAGNTYLTQTVATNIYLTKEAATQAAVNYAKIDGGNAFTGATNTFNEVSATKFSGNGVSSDISADAQKHGTKLPTCAAVATFVDSKTGTLVQTITDLQTKDNELQTQIDGINAGQNLADIVDTTAALAAYDVSHLKAKGDSLPGKPSTPLTIGDKVQVLGGADAQSSVYELIKGTKPEGEANSIVSSTNGYYWHYIGVYGTNAYTKSEIDTKVDAINSTLGTKADKTYVDDELAKKANSADVYSKTDADAKFAVKTGDNTFTGNNTFNGTIGGTAVVTRGLESNGTRLPTESAVVSFVDDSLVENRHAISDKTKIGAMGLFLYTGGDFKEMGAEIHGSLLHAVGMQLPMDGVVSWSQGTAVSTVEAETTWKLLNNTIAGEPCLVLAIRVG